MKFETYGAPNNKPKKIIGWISAGLSSFYSCYLMRDQIDELYYIEIADEHPDNARFIKDAEKIIGKPINRLKSQFYDSVENVIDAYKLIKHRNGFAPCTNQLKIQVRKDFQLENKAYQLVYIWGFDKNEITRAENMLQVDNENLHVFPLIDADLSKEQVHAHCIDLGIERPMMYELGYPNNNCIGCVKGGMGYWNKIRIDFPEVFEKRAKMERRIGYSILKECYLDELEENRGRNKSVIPDWQCSIYCGQH